MLNGNGDKWTEILNTSDCRVRGSFCDTHSRFFSECSTEQDQQTVAAQSPGRNPNCRHCHGTGTREYYEDAHRSGGIGPCYC